MLYVFKIIGKNIKYSPKREGASSRLWKDNAAGNFGDTILWPNCWTVRGALSQSILDNWAVSQELWDAVLKGIVDSRALSEVIDVQTQMQSFNFFFEIQLGVLVLRHNRQLILYFTIHIHVHVILQSSVNCKNMFFIITRHERKLVFVCFLKNLEHQNEN